METTILYRDYMEVILGLYRKNEKENGNYYRLLGPGWLMLLVITGTLIEQKNV